MLAKRCGLVKYDVKKLFNWAVERLKENKRQVEDMSISVEETSTTIYMNIGATYCGLKAQRTCVSKKAMWLTLLYHLKLYQEVNLWLVMKQI